MRLSILIAFMAIFGAQQCYSSKILMLFPSPSRSHLIVTQAITQELARRGHSVTIVSSFPLDKPLMNHNDIFIESIGDFHTELIKNLVEDSANSIAMFKSFPKMIKRCADNANHTMNHPKMKKLMAEESFDLVLIGFFMNNFILGIADHFKCPSIIITSMGSMSFTNTMVGNPLGVSGVPHLMMEFKGVMNFKQRVKNVLFYGFDLAMSAYINSITKEYYDSIFPSDKYISYEEAVANVSLILSNHHFSQGSVRPNVPALVEVGGLHIKTKPSPLPEHIKKWIDEAEHGVIFFSLGSNAKSTYLPDHKVKALINTFAKLKQRVIWKWESDVLPGKPDNVLIGKWLPQDDILAHPNVRLFMSHCGLGGMSESKYHAVPIVAIPIFADQMTNTAIIVNEGWGIEVPLKTLTQENLSAAIKEVLENPKYAKAVKQISELYRDRPATAMDTAIYWIEYVIRHRGAKHLRYPAADLNFFQRYSLDVLAFLLLVPYFLFKILAFAVRLIRPKKTEKPLGKNSKSKSKKA